MNTLLETAGYFLYHKVCSRNFDSFFWVVCTLKPDCGKV